MAMHWWRRRRMRQARERVEASKSTLEGIQSAATAKAVQRLVAAEKARLRPSDADLDKAAEITDEDIARAVDMWDDAQEAADTGLEGLLDARVSGDG